MHARTVKAQRGAARAAEEAWIWDVLPGCRRHGHGCQVPWGYDEAHTDSDRPYTTEELAARTECPHRFAYPTYDAYKEGWRLWRALRRDARPTPAEADTVWNLFLDRLDAKTTAMGRSISHLVEQYRR